MPLTRPKYSNIYDTDFKTSCRVATTTNLSNLATGAPNSLDGKSLAKNDRILVKDQLTASENGVYYVTNLGTGSNGTWTRAKDFDSDYKVTSGILIPVEEGDANSGKLYMLTTPNPITLGSTSLVWTLISSTGSSVNYANIVVAGQSTISAGTAGDSFTLVRSNNIVLTTSVGAKSITFAFDGSNAVSISNSNVSSSTLTGALVVTGGAGIGGNIYAGALYTDGYYFANGSPFSVDTSQILNGNSNVKVAANSNVTVSVAGNANVVTVTGTGANISGTANVTSNLYVGNILTDGYYFANGSPFTVDTTQIVNGNSNVKVAANSNVTVSVAGNANVVTITGTGANISGTANVSGNANVGNLGAATIIATTANLTTINSGLLQNGTSNVTVNASGNVNISVAGNVDILTVTGTGANISGTANVTGNANVGNLGTASATLTGNLNFSGTGLRITGDFSNATISNRTMFQTSTLNGPTNVYAIPNGSSTISAFSVSGNNDAGNAALGQFVQTGTDTSVRSTLTGTGSYTPITFYTGGSERARIDTSGNVGIANNAPTHTLSVTGTTNISGNANVGNLGTATAIITTANITTINSGLLQNGTSNVTVNSSGNVNISVGGNVLTVTSTGANISGTANVTGNVLAGANVVYTGNLYQGSQQRYAIAYTASGTAPTSPTSGDQWFYTTGNVLYTRVNDGTNNFWLDISSAPTSYGNLTIANLTVSTVANINAVTNHAGHVLPTANATYTLGNSTLRWANIWGLASSAQYADLAERYKSDDGYDPGTVVIFGGNAEITVTNKDHDPRVAGVISTAPGYLMNDHADQDELMLPVALTGRVPTRVRGPIRKGDMVVSSGEEGIGTRMKKALYEPGCVIGKSLENIDDESIQTIEVVVGRL